MEYVFVKKTVRESMKDGHIAFQPAVEGLFYPMVKGTGGGGSNGSSSGNTIKVVGNQNGTTNLDWPVMKGFVADHKFYLFGSEYIYIFPEEIYLQKDREHEFSQIRYADFIQCSGDVHNLASKGGLATGIIIAIVLLVLIVLLCCLLWCIREVMKRSGKKRHHRAKPGGASKAAADKQSKGTSKGSFKSVRSHQLAPAGALSAARNGSKKASSMKGGMIIPKGGSNASMHATGRSALTKYSAHRSPPTVLSKKRTTGGSFAKHSNMRTRRSGMHSRK